MLPLHDIRVLSLEQYGAGPWGTLQLADLGAEVIKIEDPASGGDVGRYVPPFAEGEDSLFFEAFNRNKKSLSLDLTSDAGRDVFHKLVAGSDVVYSNLRGDLPARLGLLYEDLAPFNPQIVCCSLSGFGTTGPMRAQPGYDYVMQAMAGWMDLTGEPGGPPTKSGLSVVDFVGGIAAAGSVLAAVHAARRDGRGMDCDLSLFDTAISLTNYLSSWHLNAGYRPERIRRSAHPSIVPAQTFQTADGWLVIQAGKEEFWRRLVGVLGSPAWATDPRYEDFAGRLEHRDVLIEKLEAQLRTGATDDWLERLTAAGVPCGRVNTLPEALAEPQVAARDLIVEFEHPRFGQVRQVRAALRAGEPRPDHRRGPTRDEHRVELCRSVAGLSADELERYARDGAFGPVA